MTGKHILSDHLVFLYGWGPEEEGRLSSLLYMVETAASMSMQASIFFFTDAAVIAKKGIAAKISQEIGERFAEIIRNEAVKIYVCSEAAAKRGITQESLEDNITIAGYPTFLNMAATLKSVITV